MQKNKPTFVVINDRRYPIRYHIADWVSVLEIADDPTLTESEKIFMQLRRVFKKKIRLEDLQGAADKLHWFIAAGMDGKRASGSKRVVDFIQDWPYIVAAFQQQYGIDLNPAPAWKFWRRPMHWWHFMQLFRGLTEETLLVKIMGYRAVNLQKIKDKETRRRYAELKRFYALAPAGQAGKRDFTPQELLEIANKKLLELKQAKAQSTAGGENG